MKQKILIVDDDPGLLELYGRILTEAGYLVVTALDGPVALGHCAGQYFDLAILDVMMPGMDGFDLAKEIRAAYEIPYLILSAKDGEDDAKKAAQVGAIGYLVKPVRNTQLLMQVKTALETMSRRSSEYLQDKRLHGLINTAKGITMIERKMDEREAHAFLIAQSRELKIRLHDLARRKIAAHELMLEAMRKDKRGWDGQ